MDFIRDLFGINSNPSIAFDIKKILIYFSFVFGTGVLAFSIIFLLFFVFKRLKLDGKFISTDLLIQKKKYLPRYRATHLIKVKGLPRYNIRNENINDQKEESNYDVKFDIVSSLAKVCDEISYWIIKHENRINIFFSISSWSWFKQEKAIEKVKQSALSLEASFKNIYPSIQFQNSTLKDTEMFLTVVENCPYGLEAQGIPARKNSQVQIDRVINTFNNMKENGFFVASFKEVPKGKERNLKTLNSKDKLEQNELVEDFLESKKNGQSSCGIYSFTFSEKGMHTLLAALLSIWSGTHTFKVKKLGNSLNYRTYNLIKKLNPIRPNRISNKALSYFIHLPEKPFLAEDTAQPIFEIPNYLTKETINEIFIGNIIQNENILDEFSIPLENLHYNTEIVGMIGRGKTYLTATIIEQLLDKEIGCLIFDLKGEYAKLFAQEENVIIYTIGEPAPLGINLFQINTENDIQNVLALINEMLIIAGTPFSPTMLNIFETALQKISKNSQQNILEFMYCLKESSIEYTKNMQTSYSRESIDAILNRLNFIFGGINYEVFSSKNNTINFSFLDEGSKIIIDLSEYLRRGASTASLFLVCNLLLHLLSKHASTKGITNKLRYLVILEEAMYFIPKRFNLESSASLGYSEQNFIMGRSLGIGTISIYQLWDSVSPVVHANSITKILFRGEDIDKIKSSITLTDEQFNYLPYLPDRNYILKTKSLSRPALLKTRSFNRKPLDEKEYLKIVSSNYLQSNYHLNRIQKSFIEIRREVFGGSNSSYRNKDRYQHRKSLSNDKAEQEYKVRETPNTSYWENCIINCPTRLDFKDKHSSWIKETVCKKVYPISKQISDRIIKNANPTTILEIIENRPEYLLEKILHSTYTDSGSDNPKYIAFCTLNLIINFLQKEYNYNHSWKNKKLNSIKSYLNNKAITDFTLS